MGIGGNADKHTETVAFIRDPLDGLPKMRVDEIDWQSASDPSEDYNCVGFAVNVLRWWQPKNAPGLIRNPRDHWPENVPDADCAIETFVTAIATEGFECCDGPAWQDGYEIIVLCFDGDRNFTHAALQVSPGRWKSKLGNLSDIVHDLEAIEGGSYGTGRQYMRRKRPSAPR